MCDIESEFIEVNQILSAQPSREHITSRLLLSTLFTFQILQGIIPTHGLHADVNLPMTFLNCDRSKHGKRASGRFLKKHAPLMVFLQEREKRRNQKIMIKHRLELYT